MAPSLMDAVAFLAAALIQPHLVPIYGDDGAQPKQIGTGFLVEHQGRAVLVTAKHVLYGHRFDENPGEKSFFRNGHLTHLDVQSRTIVKATEHDVAALVLEEVPVSAALSKFSLSSAPQRVGSPITIMGYLARDFRRGPQVLRPKPFLYTDRSMIAGTGLVGIAYAKNRARSTTSNLRVMTPIPRGVSGGPMVDTVALLRGRLEVRGVFTDHDAFKGMAYGEDASKVAALLQQI